MNGNTVVVKRDPENGTFTANGMRLNRCLDKCNIKPDPGPCEAIIPRLYREYVFIAS